MLSDWPKINKSGGAVAVLALVLGALAGFMARPTAGNKLVARTVSGPPYTVTTVVTRTRVVEAAPAHARASRAAGSPAGTVGVPRRAPKRPVAAVVIPPQARSTQRFGGSGNKLLGTISVLRPNATLHWVNSSGRFRLLFDNGAVAVDSTAPSGQIAVPPLVYSQVRVLTLGRWEMRID